MQKIAIVGVGLIGGSLGLALSGRKGRRRVAGVGRRMSTLRRAKALRSVQEITTDLASGVRGASVVVLAAPVDSIVPLAKKIRPHLSPDALVMDVGSVKGPIVRALEKIFADRRGPQFVGAHPMAGSEKTGVANARADLFRGSVCALTPGRNTTADAMRRAEKFWRSVGAKTLRLKPEDHDRGVALVSHLPHLLAFSMSLTAANGGSAARQMVSRLAAGSFRDMTRVAGADPDQWSAIFAMNSAPLRRASAQFSKILNGLLRARRPAPLLRRAKSTREKFFKAQGKN